MEEIVALLSSEDRADRLEGLARLGDELEHAVGDVSAWQRTLQTIVDDLPKEPDTELTEAALNTLVTGAERAGLAYDVAPIVTALPVLPMALVPYALELVGLTHDPKHEALLERLAGSHDPAVAEAAHEALVELRGA